MPPWGQAVAAAVIFGIGMTLGVMRGPQGVAPQTSVAANGAKVAAVTRADLVALEQRLRSEMSQTHAASTTIASATPASTPVAAAPADARILERVRTMIDESEQRQRRELAFRTAELVHDFDAQRNDDLARIERTIGQMDGTTGVEVAQQRQMLNYLMRVSQRGQ
jgi:hypothetical protein